MAKSNLQLKTDQWDGVIPTDHAQDRASDRDVAKRTASIAAHLAKPFLHSENPLKVWHDGISIVAIKTDKNVPVILTVMQCKMPSVVTEGVNLVKGMLSPVPLKFRYSGHTIIAKLVYGETVAMLAFRGAIYGKD